MSLKRCRGGACKYNLKGIDSISIPQDAFKRSLVILLSSKSKARVLGTFYYFYDYQGKEMHISQTEFLFRVSSIICSITKNKSNILSPLFACRFFFCNLLKTALH